MRTEVDVKGLEDFIEYADGLRSQVDSEFCAGLADWDDSQAEFNARLAALRMTP